MIFKVRVDHSLGFFSFYEIDANDYHKAEEEAKRLFNNQFCGGGDNITTFRGVKEQHYIIAFTFDKYKEYDTTIKS